MKTLPGHIPNETEPHSACDERVRERLKEVAERADDDKQERLCVRKRERKREKVREKERQKIRV